METWLSEEVTKNEIFPPTYTVLRSDRRFLETGLSKGGGVLLAPKSEFIIYPLNLDTVSITYQFIDIIGCKIDFNDTLF